MSTSKLFGIENFRGFDFRNFWQQILQIIISTLFFGRMRLKERSEKIEFSIFLKTLKTFAKIQKKFIKI